ncbi:MAG: transketolase family protein [Chloroflexi bacterium]|nr:transketolase family protein [Chloroflexota bacterium]
MAASETKAGPPEMRRAFGAALVELGQELPQMIVLDADLNTSSMTDRFKDAFPTRFIQVGIAEQDLFGIAAGLALEGFLPVPSTFAVFATRRALDQIAISICYPALDVKIPGSYVGLPTSRAGASHNCIEDIAVMRALPNMRVADAGDNADLRAIMRTAMATPGPVYFRVTRLTVPDIFGADHTFEWGKGVTVRTGADVTLFGTGVMTSLCIRAADMLAGDGISAEVVHLASIKPIDEALIVSSAARTGCAVTAENATILGGFGAAVAEVLSEQHPVAVQRIGVRDRWVDSGGINDLFTHHGMQPEDIAAAARRAMATRDGSRRETRT